jgi:hypothetical protein
MVDKQVKMIFKEDPRFKDHIDDIVFGYENAASLALGITANILQITEDLHFKILLNETTIPFITSDNPVVKYNQFLEDRKTFGGITGFGAKGLQLLFPLHPRIYLIFYDADIYRVGNKKQRVITLSAKRDIDELNRLQVVNSGSNLYFNQQVDVQYCEGIIATAEKFLRPNKVNVNELKPVLSRKKESLVHFYYEDVKTKFSISPISLQKRAKRYHLNGPQDHIRNPKLIKEVERDAKARSKVEA